MALEETYDVRSTFFFRTNYAAPSKDPPATYDPLEYKKDILELKDHGWEIGLHLDRFSSERPVYIQAEKQILESIAGPIYANRVHYTMCDYLLFKNLQESGFIYDASPKFHKTQISPFDTGYLKHNSARQVPLIIFPSGLVDCFIFQHLAPEEKDVLKVVKRALDLTGKQKEDQQILSINWHGCALKMKKGRLYEQVLKYLLGRSDVEIVKALDLATEIRQVFL